MNSLTLPPAPNWYLNNILACAPDDTIIYGARSDLVVIKLKKEENEAADVIIIPVAHSLRVTSVNISSNWGNPSKLAVSAGEDQVIRLWDIDTCNVQLSNKGHTVNSEKIINATFTGNDRVVSCSDGGLIIIWKLSSNESTSLKNVFGHRVKISSMSPCPHDLKLCAFASEHGLIFIADLRKNGQIVHKLRGYDKSIVSLSWCPAPFNIFPEIDKRKKSKKDRNGIEIVRMSCDENQEIRNVEAKRNDEENEDTFEDICANISKESESVCATEISEDSSEAKNNSTPEIVVTAFVEKSKTEETVDASDFENANKQIKESGRGDSVSVTESKEDETEENLNDINMESKDVSGDSNKITSQESKMLPDKHEKEHKEMKEMEREYFLASASRNGVVCVWKAGFSGRFYAELRNSRKMYCRTKKEHDWISVCWVSPRILLSSSPSGELLAWDMLEPQNDGFKPRLVHHDHCGNVFTIATNSKIIGSHDKLHSNDDVRVWTVGQDRLLLNCSVGLERKNHFCLPTIGGNVFCFASSPLDPTRIAIGFGDGVTKVWDLSRPHCQYITMINLWQKMYGKVLSLAWHPTKELLLAYGTCEGRVGTVDVYNTSKAPVLLTQYFKSEIYHLEWGPFQNDVNNHALYVYANNQLVVYNIKKPLNEPNVLLSENVMSFSWKSDYSVLAVGTKSGEVHFYRMDVSPLSTIFLLKRVRSLVWHPIEMDEKSANWLAITTNENVFYVYNCEVVGGVCVNSTLIATLDGHDKRVNAVAWSPHEYNKVVSIGEDGVALVWNVETQQIVGVFFGKNYEPITTVLWSPLDKDFVITGGRDNSIRIWKISEHSQLKKDVITQRKKLPKPPKVTTEDESEALEESSKDRKKQENVLKSLTHLHNANLLDDCKRLFNSHFEENEEVESDVDCLDMFKGPQEMSKLLDCARKSNDMKRKPHCEQMISLWMGDITESIKEAIKNGNVTPWLISLAPMASPRLWFQACEAYVNQLMEKAGSDPLEIVSYLLACHKVEEAVNVLIDAVMFREALAIAKVRLPQNVDLVNKILDKWTVHCNYTGQYELAAQIFIHLRQYGEAAKILYKRSDAKTLGFALELAEKANNKDLRDAILARYKIFVDKEIVNSLPDAPKNNLKTDVGDIKMKNIVDEETVFSIENTVNKTENKESKTVQQQN